jgi:hypothetical protein
MNAILSPDFPMDADRRLTFGAIEVVFTHLSCAQSFRPTPATGISASGGQAASYFHSMGRIRPHRSPLQERTVTSNLPVPPHRCHSEAALLIGSDPTA